MVLVGATAAWILVTGEMPRWRRRLAVPDGRSVMSAATAGVVGFIGAQALLGVFPAALAIALLASVVPLAVMHRRGQMAAAAVRSEWPDILLRIRSAVSAGSTVADATIDSLRSAGGEFPSVAELLRSEVVIGSGFAAGASRARALLDDPVSDRVFVTLAAASTAGGRRVGEVIGTLARSVGDELRLYAAHDAALTEQRWTVNVALVAPWVLLCLTIATNPQAREAFATGEGAIVVGIGFAATVVGWLTARRSARLSSVPRVFE